MADPFLFFFDPVEKLTFVQNEFRAAKESAAAFLYWFPPGTNCRLQAWTQAPLNDRAPAFNDLTNWDATGGARSIQGVEGKVINLNEDMPARFPFPWAPLSSVYGKNSVLQAMIPKQNSTGGDYPTNLNGTWTAGQPQDCVANNDSWAEFDDSSPQVCLKTSQGAITYNAFSVLKNIENRITRDVSPQVLVFDQAVQNSGCVSILEVPNTGDGFVTIRTTLLTVTTDNVAYRSVMPQIVRGGGFVAFGYV